MTCIPLRLLYLLYQEQLIGYDAILINLNNEESSFFALSNANI